MLLHSPNQVWQSDIPYIKVNGVFYYVVFIIDVYTKKIVGYHVSDSLRADANMKALKMALKNHKAPQIHHSDLHRWFKNRERYRTISRFSPNRPADSKLPDGF